MAKTLPARTLALGGLAVAAAAGAALKNRDRVMGLFGRGTSISEPPPLPAPSEAPVGEAASEPAPMAAPAIANADAAGPPANTATHVPAPEPQIHDPAGGIDEAAEEAAAAAEAANIGGSAPDYPGDAIGELADEADRPLIEAGEGVAEGQEVAEWELADYAEPAAGDPIEGGRQIDDVIEAQDDPFAGEQPFDDQSSHGNPRAEAEQSAVGTADPLETPPEGSDPNAPGAMGETTEGGAPTPPNPGATTTDASAAQFASGGSPDAGSPATPRPDTGDTLAAGSINEGAPTTGGTLSGLTEPAPAAEEGEPAAERPRDREDGDDGAEWQTWSGRAVEP